MEALVPVFIAVLLAETGGTMQAQVQALARAGKSSWAILGLVALAGLVLLGVAAAASVSVAALMPPDARALFFALALLAAGVPMLWPRKPVPVTPASGWMAPLRLAARMASDAAPFIVLAASARTGQPVLAVAGGVAALLAQAHLPLVFDDWPGRLPVRAIRVGAGALITLAGLMTAVSALGIG